MPAALPHTTICLRPDRRTAVLPVRPAVQRAGASVLEQPRVAYSAHHTTAGFLDAEARSATASTASALRAAVAPYQALFPYGAGYQHDQMHLRTELRPEQRRCEPRNADAHLTYIGAGLVACVHLDASAPLALVDLDGVNRETGRQRTRQVTAVGFSEAKPVSTFEVGVPAPQDAVGATSLRDPRLGLITRIQAALTAQDVGWGCVAVALAGAETEAALVVNEYEPQLMQHDVAALLRMPQCFPTKASVAAGSAVEAGASPPDAPPLRLASRIRMMVRPPAENGTSRLVQGRYQSPILLHRTARHRSLRVTVFRYV